MENYFKEFLTGQAITLQQMTSSDLEAFVKIESEQKTLLLANDDIPFPNTFEDHSSFFQSISGKKEEFIFGIFEKSSNELIGSCGVYGINWKNSTCFVGISIGEQWHGKGLGTDAMNTLIHFIFNYISINKIKLQVFSFNKGAIRSYEKCGFTKEGSLRNELFRFGQFHDVLLFGLLREEWTQLEKQSSVGLEIV
ncbi:GNAT family N-acetyltransferase [Lysinibacillus xylanilyticus]|uniref:GNAT family N-acetyltransferase n=1 Tax=Lysinibacillus xylanilyticus TaxID=582475 RepID=UPI002B241ECD|nr:GNAT family protein [Lysinibacillus xylanilyticus]MEB2301493.1 GNAT family N-acetyltransferase [Lysinibacillus xylanilyticus]